MPYRKQKQSQFYKLWCHHFYPCLHLISFFLTLPGYKEDIKESKHLIQPEIRITQHISDVSLTPLLEQEGEGHVERGSSLRRHSVSDGRSVITDMQLLTVTSRMHSGSEEPCGTINKIREKAKRAHSQVNTIFESQSC